MKNEKHTSTIMWLSRTAGKKKGLIFCLVGIQIALGLSNVLFTFLFRSLVDFAMAGEKDDFFKIVVKMAGLMASQAALRALEYFLYEWTCSTMENVLKSRLFSCLLDKHYADVVAVHSGEWMNRLTSDTVVVAGGMVEILPGVTGLLARLGGALAAMYVLEPIFVYILVPGGLLAFLVTYLFRRVLKRLHKRIQEADGVLRIFLQEHLGSLMIVRAFGMEEGTEKKAIERMRQHKTVRMKRNLLSNICSTAFLVAAGGLYLFGAIYCGYGILQGTISYGTMMAMLQLIGQVQSPVANITGYLPRYYTMIASAERLMEAEYFAEDCTGNRISVQEIERFYREEFTAIGLRRACFSYQPLVQETEAGENADCRPIVLDQVNLEIKKGEYVAFTGHSGCGKSTVLKLLMSLYPLEAGERYISGLRPFTDNREIGRREQPLDARWRGLFAYVPQGNQLMSGTIREAVAFGDSEGMRQEERLREALRIACADEFVGYLPDGLDTLLGERGSGLSEGQMQRLAIARAIFSGHPILMLDEATSALDEETERKLLTNLKSMTDKTVLIVTHRLAVLQICDKQIAMTQGGCRTVC